MEEEVGLDSLINQRKGRPSYTRMVSWEFSQQQDKSPVKRTRRNSKRQLPSAEEEITEDSSSDDGDVFNESMEGALSDSPCTGSTESDLHKKKSEHDHSSSNDDSYFSAKEDISSSSGSDSDICQQLSPLDIAADKTGVENRDISHGQSHHGKHRAPSKKQKRKRRMHEIESVIDGDSILRMLDFDIVPDIISETKFLAEQDQIAVDKQVPSLLELCLNCMRRRKSQASLPKGLKNAIKHSNIDFTFRKFQVSWLQSAFSEWQPFDNRKKWQLYYACSGVGPYSTHSRIPTRNIWNSHFYPKYNYCSYGYVHSKTSAILPFTFVSVKDIYVDVHTSSSFVFHQRFMGTFAMLVDLMMPTVLTKSNGSENQPESESAQLSTAMETATVQVKKALGWRFPDIVDLFFDKIVPYVFWARGDIHQATALFVKLVEGDTRNRYRAMCLVEIARMHTQLGEPEAACRFYRLASDLALEKGRKSAETDEVAGQTLMLIANVYDQGMMTPEKMQISARHWEYIMTNPQVFKDGAANMAAISLLCFHSTPGTKDGPSSFDEAKKRFRAMVEVCPQYLYYLSMLHALAGHGLDALNTYNEFLQRGNIVDDRDDPGMMILPSTVSTSNEWHELVVMVTQHGPPQPLRVLWRAHLQPLRVCEPSVAVPTTEADLCCDDLDLRLNSQGYLTGNMKLVLPPIRGINLHPYTGKLCFPQTPGRTEPWTSVDRFINSNDSDFGFMPCPVEIYRHDNGTTVQMIMTAPLRKNTDFCRTKLHRNLTFFWSDGKGQRAKLNLLKKFEHLVYEKITSKIKRTAVREKKPVKWQEDCLKLLKSCYDNKRELKLEWIEKTLASLNDQSEMCPKSQRQRRRIDLPDSPELTLSKSYAVYGNTVILTFEFNKVDIVVHMVCSSREAFLDTEPKFDRGSRTCDGLVHCIPNWRNNTVPGAEIYCYTYKKKEEVYLVPCDQKGRKIDEIKKEAVAGDEALPYIIGSSLLMIIEGWRLWCWHDKVINIDKELPDISKIYPLQSSVVMVTVKDREVLRFVDTPSLGAVSIRTDCDMKGIDISEDHLEIRTKFYRVKVLTTRTVADRRYQEVVLGLDTFLVSVTIAQNPSGPKEVIITDVLPLPGRPVEHCFVGEKSGYLLSWTQLPESAKLYQEHVSYFSHDSQLLGVLPCLGKGPRCFYPAYLFGDTDTETEHPGYGQPGWYVYMRDGHDGILGVKLPNDRPR